MEGNNQTDDQVPSRKVSSFEELKVEGFDNVEDVL